MRARPLIIIDTAIIGGPGRGLFQLLKKFHEESVNYLLTNFRYRRSKSNEFFTQAKKVQANIVQLQQSFFLDPRPIWQFIKLARQGKYNLIQSHGYKSHLLAAIAARVLNIPWLAFAHGWTAEDRKVSIYHRLDRTLLKYATVVVAVSPELKEIFTKLRGPHKPTQLIFNAVDISAIASGNNAQAIRSKLKIDKHTTLIGCFGRLSFEKGQDILLRVFAKISQHFPSCELLFLGDGPLLNKLKELSEQLGIASKVHFCPYQNQIGDYYQAIDLLALPSRSEGLPNVLLEAMSFSVPVIASNVGAVPAVLTYGVNGLTFSPNDEKALYDCLRAALSEPLRLNEIGRAGAASLKTKFCPQKRAQTILNLYEEICA